VEGVAASRSRSALVVLLVVCIPPLLLPPLELSVCSRIGVVLVLFFPPQERAGEERPAGRSL
jgi:hypothetical protein